jgi:hypothetical protein
MPSHTMGNDSEMSEVATGILAYYRQADERSTCDGLDREKTLAVHSAKNQRHLRTRYRATCVWLGVCLFVRVSSVLYFETKEMVDSLSETFIKIIHEAIRLPHEDNTARYVSAKIDQRKSVYRTLSRVFLTEWSRIYGCFHEYVRSAYDPHIDSRVTREIAAR